MNHDDWSYPNDTYKPHSSALLRSTANDSSVDELQTRSFKLNVRYIVWKKAIQEVGTHSLCYATAPNIPACMSARMDKCFVRVGTKIMMDTLPIGQMLRGTKNNNNNFLNKSSKCILKLSITFLRKFVIVVSILLSHLIIISLFFRKQIFTIENLTWLLILNKQDLQPLYTPIKYHGRISVPRKANCRR